MCFCCCDTRKGILIYSIVISTFAFIYGIIVIAEFGSKTDVYEALIKKIEYLEAKGDTNTNSDDFWRYYFGYYSKRKLPFYNYPYGYYSNDEAYEYAKNVLDIESMDKISSLTYKDLQEKKYDLIKRLKGIENGLGIILFIFPLIFLVAEIVYIIFVCGIKETQVLRMTTYTVFNILKITTMTLAIIFILLALLYSILLMLAMIQYKNIMSNADSCVIGIIIGIIFGYYSCIYYIILSCNFSREHRLFKEVGSADRPGPKAQYDIFGNPIIRPTLVVQQVIGVTPQMIGQPIMSFNLPYQQVPNQFIIIIK